MRAITISREYGAGGGEVARRLAEALGWELLDRELLHEAARIEHIPDAELARLDERAVSLADRFRIHPPHERYLRGLSEAARQAARRGNVVLVGRGARHLLGEMPDVFHLRLVAPRPWRVERIARIEDLPSEVARVRCLEADRSRQLFMRYFFGDAALRPDQYDLVVNAAWVPLEEVVDALAAIIRLGAAEVPANPGRRCVLTLSRELGAGEPEFAAALAQRLSVHVYDRELLEQEAVRLGIPQTDLEKIDERAAGIFQRFHPGSIYQRYIAALGQIMQQLAQRGEVILVGRAGNCFLRDDPQALHIRLVAPMAIRVRRVMEYRWVREGVARKLIAESDAQRQSFCESYFGVDWASPLEYHLTVNTGRMGPAAVDLVAIAATRHWSRTE